VEVKLRKKVILSLVIVLAAILIAFLILNIDTLKPYVLEAKNVYSLVKLVKKETGFKKVSISLKLDNNEEEQGLYIGIDDDYTGDLKKMAEKIQLLAFDNYAKDLDYVEVIYKMPAVTVKVKDKYLFGSRDIKRFYLSKEQFDKIKSKQP